MLTPLLIAALLTAAASEEDEDPAARTNALRKKLFPTARQVPSSLLSIEDFKRVDDFAEQALLHLGFSQGYAESVSSELFDDWMNMDPELEDTMSTPWFIRFDREPVVPREPHEVQAAQVDLAAAPFFRQQAFKQFRQIPHFEDEYFEQLADALTDGWLHRDRVPRWDTHSRFGMQAQALYWKYRSLGWPHDEAQSNSWAGGDEQDQLRLLGAELPPFFTLQRKAQQLTEAMLGSGFDEKYAEGATRSLIWYHLGQAVPGSPFVGERGIWSHVPDPERARFENRIYTHMLRALKHIVSMKHPDAEKVAHKMAKDWVYSMRSY